MLADSLTRRRRPYPEHNLGRAPSSRIRKGSSFTHAIIWPCASIIDNFGAQEKNLKDKVNGYANGNCICRGLYIAFQKKHSG